MATIQERAREMYQAFERKTRDNGDEFTCLKEGSPEWMTDVIHEAHKDGSPGFDGTPGTGHMFPDDTRYEMIRDVLSAIIEHEDDEEAGRDSLEAPIYTHELTGWLHSRADRYGYCDEAIEEYGGDFRAGRDGSGMIQILQLGYMRELEEVFGEVFEALTELVSDDEDEDEDEGDYVAIEEARGTTCAYCQLTVWTASAPPTDDDVAWAAIAVEHAGDCEWVTTRAHTIFA